MGNLKRILSGIGYFCAAPALGAFKKLKRHASRSRREMAAVISHAMLPLEPRLLMTTTLYWAPSWNSTTHDMGGSGTWDTSSLAWNTQADGLGTQRSWMGAGYGYGSSGTPGTDAVFGSAGGTVIVSGNLYSESLGLSFTADG
jgi:hypothetical protein